METLLHWDEQLFLFLNNLGNDNWDGFWLLITNKKTWIPLYILLLIILFRRFGWKITLFITILMVVMIGFTDQIANLFKEEWVQRLRPCKVEQIEEQMRLVKDGCGGKYGYFSAHAANHFAIAILLGNILFQQQKLIYFLLLIWASLIAYSRIYIGVHYPLDVITGIFVGIIMGLIFTKIYYLIFKKYFK